MLHIERKKWYSMVQVINLEIGKDEGAVDSVRCHLFGEETRELICWNAQKHKGGDRSFQTTSGPT